jgi:hypothetical protein
MVADYEETRKGGLFEMISEFSVATSLKDCCPSREGRNASEAIPDADGQLQEYNRDIGDR